MQLFQQPFDANTIKPQEAFEPLPAGWYNAKVVANEAKPTKDNKSGYLQLDLEIIDGEHKGRKVFDRLNLWNQGDNATKTREIAQRQLSAYCHATGVFILQDSNQLHGIPLKIKLAIQQSEGYDPSNDVKAVKHIQDSTPATAAPAFPSAPAVPFGQNPSLPPQLASPDMLPVSSPSSAWAQTSPASMSPGAPTAHLPPQFAPPAQQTPWAPPAASAQPTALPASPRLPWQK